MKPSGARKSILPPPTLFAPQPRVQAKPALAATRLGPPPPPTRFGSSATAQGKLGPARAVAPRIDPPRPRANAVQMMEDRSGGMGITYQTVDKDLTPEMEREILRRYTFETGETSIPAHGSRNSNYGQNDNTTKNLKIYNRIKREVKEEFRSKYWQEQRDNRHVQDDSQWDRYQSEQYHNQLKSSNYGTSKKVKTTTNKNEDHSDNHWKYHTSWHNTEDQCPYCGVFGNDKPDYFK